MKMWNVGIYVRVSTSKEEQRDSIPAQVQSLKEWIHTKNAQEEDKYVIVKVFEDRGTSGSNFDRESFQEMKEYIEKGQINMVLTRDLSRFGRNYILAGYYVEEYFKVNAVRFVSVLDNVDTIDELNDIVPFKNVLNEMYIKDCSRRSRDGLKQRMVRGSYIGSKPPYGYEKIDVEEHGQKTIKLVPAGDETTDTVRLIFKLYLEGWGYAKIANYLNEQQIPSPSTRVDFPLAKWHKWNDNGVKSILTNPKYAGIMTQGQYKKVSYKLKKIIKLPEENWVYGGEFEGIVSKETFEKVQEYMGNRGKAHRHREHEVHLFSGVMICGDCDGAMGYRKRYEGYKCINSQKGGKRCTAHSVKEKFLLDTIRRDLKEFVKAINQEEIFERMKGLIDKDYDTIKKRIKNIDNELEKLDGKIKKLYEDRLEEVITLRNFQNFSKDLSKRQDALSKERDELRGKLENMTDIEEKHQLFRGKIKEILKFNQLTRKNIDDLVEKIVVHEDKDTGLKHIDIRYKFANPLKNTR